MSLADYDAYVAALTAPSQVVTSLLAPSGITAGRLYDSWPLGVPAGSAPSTAAAPTSATAGALPFVNGTGTLGIVGAYGCPTGVNVICDRLSHQGGLSGTVTTAQTTNLATAALTRYTSGDGVMMGLSIYSQVGTTATTVTCSYTNQAGTSGRTSTAVVFGSTGFREASRMVLLPLQAGDTGVRSVESVTVLASTGTAGNFGVTLFKPLFMAITTVNVPTPHDLISGNMGGGLAEVVDDACLFNLAMAGTGVGNGGAQSHLFLTEW